MHDVSGAERTSVVERDVWPQVECVGAAVGGDIPACGERRREVRVDGELGEAVKEVRDGAARRHVGRKSGIERARIVAVARVDERFALRSRVGAAAGAHERKRNDGETNREGEANRAQTAPR